MADKLAYNYAEAAETTGYSKDVIRRAVDNNELVARFANTKPVIKASELTRWLDGLPTESRKTTRLPQ
jgi:hypothetical protein